MISSQSIPYFKQGNYYTCVLASFALASSCFTQTPVEEYFRDYCTHFDLDTNNPYDSYDKHFHSYLNDNQISGNKLIFDLFKTSNTNSYSSLRKVVSASYLEFNNQYQLFEYELKEKEALLTVFKNSIGHNIMIGCDIDETFYWIETRNGNEYIIKEENIVSIGRDLGDGILIHRL